MGHAALGTYSVLAVVSVCCPHPEGRLFTCYSPVCHSIPERASSFPLFVRLACVKHAASVRPEPGSNSYVQFLFIPAGSSFNSPAFHSSFARVSSPGFAEIRLALPRSPPTSPGLSPGSLSLSCVSHYTVFKVRFVLFGHASYSIKKNLALQALLSAFISYYI